MKLPTILPVALFGLLAATFGLYLFQVGAGKNIQEIPSALIDKPAPPLDLPPIAGRRNGLASAQLADKVSLVNVFASWCPPCRVEHPMLMRLAREGVPIYGINYKDRPQDALGFLDRLGDPYRAIGADATGRAAIDWGVYGYPETFVVDRTGRIRYKHIGPIMPRDLDSRIRPILQRLAQ